MYADEAKQYIKYLKVCFWNSKSRENTFEDIVTVFTLSTNIAIKASNNFC